MFTQTFETVERFSPYSYRCAVEMDDEAVKENLCRALAAVNTATEALAQLDTSDIDEVENGVDNIISALKAVRREKTIIKRNDHRKNQYTDYMDIILNNTEVGGTYVMSHLMEELSEVVKAGRYREDSGYNPEMFRTVMDVLIEAGTFKVTKISTITLFIREK